MILLWCYSYHNYCFYFCITSVIIARDTAASETFITDTATTTTASAYILPLSLSPVILLQGKHLSVLHLPQLLLLPISPLPLLLLMSLKVKRLLLIPPPLLLQRLLLLPALVLAAVEQFSRALAERDDSHTTTELTASITVTASD